MKQDGPELNLKIGGHFTDQVKKKKQVDTNLVMVELRVFQPKIELSTMTIPYAFRLGLRQYLRPSN